MLGFLSVMVAHLVLAQAEQGQLHFEVVTIDEAGMRAVPFSDSENRYALVAVANDELVDVSLRLGSPEAFSPFQSSQVLALPPGVYAVIGRTAPSTGIDLGGRDAEPLAYMRIRPNEWVRVRCLADGPPGCVSERVRGFSTFW